MSAAYLTRAAKALRVFCPIQPHTLDALLGGDASALERDTTLSQMLSIIRADGPLGDFGVYKSVVEISPGWELFRPQAAAQPTLGEPGAAATSPTAVLTIYVAADVPSETLGRALERLLAAHPWEVPVIELSETSLLIRRQLPQHHEQRVM